MAHRLIALSLNFLLCKTGVVTEVPTVSGTCEHDVSNACEALRRCLGSTRNLSTLLLHTFCKINSPPILSPSLLQISAQHAE